MSSPQPSENTITNYLTIDIEDYFQVSAFEYLVGYENWDKYASRVEANTKKILDILGRYDIKATFFILGWTAKKHQNLVKEIHATGHEIACHSYCHRLVYKLTPEEFRKDTSLAKDILEQITGTQIRGFRAPSYSITNQSLWALQILEELNFEFDSSIFPIYHDRYGIPEAPRFKYKIPGYNLTEYPISTSLLWRYKIPVSGGGYFRLFPYWFTKNALNNINKKEGQPFIFYLHPWEIDDTQPKFHNARWKSRFRHYNNLHKTASRFERLLSDFKFGPITRT